MEKQKQECKSRQQKKDSFNMVESLSGYLEDLLDSKIDSGSYTLQYTQGDKKFYITIISRDKNANY